MKLPNKITGANAGGPCRLPIRTLWAARIAQFRRSSQRLLAIGFRGASLVSMLVKLPLEKMSRTEKLMAMEALWADLSQDEALVDSPPWHGDVLRESEQLVKAGKAKFMDWDTAKAVLRRRVAKRK
jgi:Putative addiction module component